MKTSTTFNLWGLRIVFYTFLFNNEIITRENDKSEIQIRPSCNINVNMAVNGYKDPTRCRTHNEKTFSF